MFPSQGLSGPAGPTGPPGPRGDPGELVSVAYCRPELGADWVSLTPVWCGFNDLTLSSPEVNLLDFRDGC